MANQTNGRNATVHRSFWTRLVSLLLALSYMFTFVALGDVALGLTAYAEEDSYVEKDGFSGTIIDNKIHLTNCNSDAIEITIPEQINGYDVTDLGIGLFSGCINAKKIYVPDTVTSIFMGFGIAPGTFSCPNLTDIIVDDNNQQYCDVDGVVFTKDLTSIIAYPSGRTDNEYTIPTGVVNISKGIFYKCSELENVIIPDTVETIGNSAFLGCNKLTDITLPDSVRIIDDLAFYPIYNLSENENKVLYIDKWVYYIGENVEHATIKNGTKHIANSVVDRNFGAFNDYLEKDSILKSVTFPDGMISIGDDAFSTCKLLEKAVIPNSVTSIGKGAFPTHSTFTIYGCSGSYVETYANENNIPFKALFANGAGTEDNPYQIETAEQLNNIRYNLDAHYELVADIDLSAYPNWEPIGTGYTYSSGLPGNPDAEWVVQDPFMGSFNGNSHTISNLTIISSGYDSVGLFGVTCGEISNVNLSNIHIEADRKNIDYSEIWDEYRYPYLSVGGIAGTTKAPTSLDNTPIISNCIVDGTISVKDCYSAIVGGITGYGCVLNSTNKADITVNANKSGRSENDSDIMVGGIVGNTDTVNSPIEMCVNYGNISATAGNSVDCGGINGRDGKISYCVNYGNISGSTTNASGIRGFGNNTNVGGIVGATSSDDNSNVVNYGNISATSNCANNNYTYRRSSAGGIAGYVGYGGSGYLKESYNISDTIFASSSNNSMRSGRVVGDTGGYGNELNSNFSINTTNVNGSIPTENIGHDQINGESMTKDEIEAAAKKILDKINSIDFYVSEAPVDVLISTNCDITITCSKPVIKNTVIKSRDIDVLIVNPVTVNSDYECEVSLSGVSEGETYLDIYVDDTLISSVPVNVKNDLFTNSELISFTRNIYTVGEGGSVSISAQYFGTDKLDNVEWSTADNDIISIERSFTNSIREGTVFEEKHAFCQIKGLKAGKAVLKLNINGQEAYVLIAVEPITLSVYANRTDLNVLVDETFDIVGKTLSNETIIESDITYSYDETALKWVNSFNYENGFEDHYTFKALKEGTHTITITDNTHNIVRIVPIKVDQKQNNSHTIYNVPINYLYEDKDYCTNFIINGMYIDEFRSKLHETSAGQTLCDITFDVYNTKSVFGIADVYDADGNLLKSLPINPVKNMPTGIWEGSAGNLWELAEDWLWEGDILTHRQSAGYSEHTAIYIEDIPQGGWIRITNNPTESVPLAVIDSVDIILSYKAFSNSSLDGYESIRNALADELCKKIPEHIVGALAQDGDKLIREAVLSGITSHATENGFQLSIEGFANAFSGWLLEFELEDIVKDVVKSYSLDFAESLFTSLSGWVGLTLEQLMNYSQAINLTCKINDFSNSIYASREHVHIPRNGTAECENITAIGNFDSYTSLNIFRIEIDEEILNSIPNITDNNSEYVYNYDISLYRNGEQIQPQDDVKIRIKIPSNLYPYKNNLKIRHINSDGTIEELPAYIDGNEIVFVTSHFSEFILYPDFSSHRIYFDDESITVTRTEVILKDGDTVSTGDTLHITAYIPDGYKLKSLKVNGTEIENGGKYVVGEEDVVITVEFEEIADEPDPFVTGISMNAAPQKTSYYIGEALDLAGATIRISYSDGESEIIDVTANMVSGFDSSSVGTKTITVTFDDFTTSFNVTVRKKSSGGGGGTGGGSSSNRPVVDTSYPIVNGEEMNWLKISNEINKLNPGDTIYVDLNGDIKVPAFIFMDLNDNLVTMNSKFNDEFTWVVDGRKTGTPEDSALLNVRTAGVYIPGVLLDKVQGEMTNKFHIDETIENIELSVSVGKEHNGLFANLYRYNSDTYKLDFVAVATVDSNGNALIPADIAGDYVIMVDEYSALPGDVDNNGVLNIDDAMAILQYILDIISLPQIDKADYNQDDIIKALDAAAILKELDENE